MTTERPILFSAPMVRAILEGRKTQTRRVVKPQPSGPFNVIKPRYGKPGDRLWVRETFSYSTDRVGALAGYSYRASINGMKEDDYVWSPSIFMPRAASRILLEISDVRIERLRKISNEDAKAEGIRQCEGGAFDYIAGCDAQGYSPRESFASLWDSINGASPFGWASDPYVFVISFRRVK